MKVQDTFLFVYALFNCVRISGLCYLLLRNIIILKVTRQFWKLIAIQKFLKYYEHNVILKFLNGKSLFKHFIFICLLQFCYQKFNLDFKNFVKCMIFKIIFYVTGQQSYKDKFTFEPSKTLVNIFYMIETENFAKCFLFNHYFNFKQIIITK